MTGALTRYRVLAYATGVMLLLLTLHVIVQAVQLAGDDSATGLFGEPGLNSVAPGSGHVIPILHGWLYLIYVVLAVDLWFRTRLPAVRMVLVVIAGTVPFMSFVAERWVTHRVRALTPVGLPG